MDREERDGIITFLRNAVIVATKVEVESGADTDRVVENIVAADDRHRLTVTAADHVIEDDLVLKRKTRYEEETLHENIFVDTCKRI